MKPHDQSQRRGSVRLLLIIFFMDFIGTAFLGCVQEKDVEKVKHEARMIVDMAGRSVTVPAKVDRIVDTLAPVTHIIYLVGAQDKHVGTCSYTQGRTKLMQKIDPKYLALPAVVESGGSAPNIEEILKLNPDVVICHNTEKQIKPIEAAGIPCIALDLLTAGDLEKAILLVGKVVGNVEKAKAFIFYRHVLFEKVTSVTSKIPRGERKKVYFATYGVLKSHGRESFIHDVIEMAGGRDFSEILPGWSKWVSIEEVLKWDPEVIFVDLPEYKKEIVTNSQWSKVTAVKNGDVYISPIGAYSWDRPGPESTLLCPWMAKKLYPEKFGKLDMEHELKEYYERVYNSYSPSHGDTFKVLHPSR
ncbi:MAG: ABC transporter substrate-binding protein [Caldisericia bacterium]|nr:ABC transporter substrate-binding protein [Caldisericia bacterium]